MNANTVVTHNKTTTLNSQQLPTPLSRFPLLPTFYSLLPILLLASCSFDYGQQQQADKSQPDIVMENVDYVRVRSADPVARFQAEHAERYEERRLMELRNFSFEQFGNHGEEVNAFGKAGSASVEIDSGDIRLADGVRIDVESEDIAIETKQLEWKDKPRTLSAGAGNEVNIYQGNGTSFSGIGFQADARRRTWEFAEGASGSYIHDDDKDDKDKKDEKEDAGKTDAASVKTGGEKKSE